MTTLKTAMYDGLLEDQIFLLERVKDRRSQCLAFCLMGDQWPINSTIFPCITHHVELHHMFSQFSPSHITTTGIAVSTLVLLGNGLPLIAQCRQILVPVSTPFPIVNRCCSGFVASGGI